jgi:carbon storage regulator
LRIHEEWRFMLVLRRKVGETIILDGVITISVLAVEGERVKIGINAPPDVTIVREELLRAVVAASASPQDDPAPGLPDRVAHSPLA